jgi:uncharacterized SAM-binding protein YcdF (DUF218 family)
MQDAYLLLKALVTGLVLPPGGPLVIALAGLALWSRRPRLARTFVAFGVISLAALSMPVVATLLAQSFSAREPLDVGRAGNARAIVILGGGTQPKSPEYGGETLGRLSLERVRYGARVARQTGLPVLVSGGSVRGKTAAESIVMRDALVSEYGIAPRWIEDASRNTHENVVLSAQMLARDGVRTIVLIGHAFDMPRTLAEFRDAGIEAIPAPTRLPGDLEDLELSDFLPSTRALESSYYTLYEMLAYAVYQARRAFAGVEIPSRKAGTATRPAG